MRQSEFQQTILARIRQIGCADQSHDPRNRSVILSTFCRIYVRKASRIRQIMILIGISRRILSTPTADSLALSPGGCGVIA